MSEQQTLPPRVGRDFADQPHAYDPVRQSQLFDGVIFKRIDRLPHRRHHHLAC